MEPAKDSQGITSDGSPLDSRPGGRRLASYAHHSSALRMNNPKIKLTRRILSPLNEPYSARILHETILCNLWFRVNANSRSLRRILLGWLAPAVALSRRASASRPRGHGRARAAVPTKRCDS